jgi:tRNA pseudouridine38-40 synthase
MTSDDGFFVIEFRSEYFLWNLIRRIVAAISSVGRGDSTIEDVKRALNGEPVSFGVARPDALTLVDVIYDNIKFVAPGTDMFRSRLEEEKLKRKIRRAFFDTL